jgi:AcrR family transcriptional regulator
MYLHTLEVSDGGSTDERILRAFLTLAADQGFTATTTRAIAATAGVNEITVFRRFGNKIALAREAIRRFAPPLGEIELAIDASTTHAARAGMVRILRSMRIGLRERPEFVQLGLGEAWHVEELRQDIAATPLAALDLVRRALTGARSQLRPAVDQEATARMLHGLVLLTTLWQQRGWLELDDAAIDQLLEAAVRPLFREGCGM